MTDTVRAVFSGPDMLDRGNDGLPRVNEVVLTAAERVVSGLRPLALAHGFADSVQGAASVMAALMVEAATSVQAGIDLVKILLAEIFGPDDRQDDSELPALLWTSLLLDFNSPVLSHHAFLQHLALPHLERRRLALPRTMAYVQALNATVLRSSARNETRPGPVVWVLGATRSLEGQLAASGAFEDAGCWSHSDEVREVYLVGDFAGSWPGKRVEVRARPWMDLYRGELPEPETVFFCHTGLGTLEPGPAAEWLPRLADLLLSSDAAWAPILVLSCRCEAEAQGERAVLQRLGARGFRIKDTTLGPHVRNLFSGRAGDPEAEFDDHGWLTICRGTSLDRDELLDLVADVEGFCAAASQLAEDEAKRAGATARGEADAADKEGRAGKAGKSRAVYWGILDLKFDSGQPLEDRVKVLEAGDGRASRFSGYGAAIKESFAQEHKLEDALRREVLVENKKLTHDLMLDQGYGFLRPRQACRPRVYGPGLAEGIRGELRLGASDACVLKLTNRQRGAGVVPVPAADLDRALQQLLQPDASWQATPLDWALQVPWGCFEEQVRHWWSNECPCFVVEELCSSQPTELGSRGYDGTMRVGFTLHRDDRPELPPGSIWTENGAVPGTSHPQGQDELAGAAPGAPGRRPYLSLYRPDSALRQQWLGGYWKLPTGAMDSEDLRGKVVSVAKKGTAPVPAAQLHEVYAALGEMLPALFGNAGDLTHQRLTKRYSAFPELAAFMVARLACSVLRRDKSRAVSIINLARAQLSNVTGPLREMVMSYISRCLGVAEARFGLWAAAQPYFAKSLEQMPTNASGRNLLGTCLLEEGSALHAARLFEESILLDPDFRAPYVNLGVCYLRIGKYQRALEVSEAILLRHPFTHQAHYNAGAAMYVLLCRAEASGQAVDQAQRDKARKSLELANRNMLQSEVWTELDERMLARLRDESPLSLPPPQGLPREGWKFLAWRF